MPRKEWCALKTEKTVYVCGALTELTPKKLGKARGFYESIADVAQDVLGVRAFVPHEHFDPVTHPRATPREVDKAERDQICNKTSLLVVVTLAPSWGGGIEVEMANMHGVPVVILCEKEKLKKGKISRLLRGNPAVRELILYAYQRDALDQLRGRLTDWRKSGSI